MLKDIKNTIQRITSKEAIKTEKETVYNIQGRNIDFNNTYEISSYLEEIEILLEFLNNTEDLNISIQPILVKNKNRYAVLPCSGHENSKRQNNLILIFWYVYDNSKSNPTFDRLSVMGSNNTVSVPDKLKKRDMYDYVQSLGKKLCDIANKAIDKVEQDEAKKDKVKQDEAKKDERIGMAKVMASLSILLITFLLSIIMKFFLPTYILLLCILFIVAAFSVYRQWFFIKLQNFFIKLLKHLW